MGGEDHRCEWREKAEKLEADVRNLRGELTSMQGTLEKLQRHVFGKRSEKMPRVADAIRDPDHANAERIAALQLRRESPTTRGSARNAAATSSRSSATGR